jgi:hypothetical protein
MSITSIFALKALLTIAAIQRSFAVLLVLKLIVLMVPMNRKKHGVSEDLETPIDAAHISTVVIVPAFVDIALVDVLVGLCIISLSRT